MNEIAGSYGCRLNPVNGSFRLPKIGWAAVNPVFRQAKSRFEALIAIFRGNK